MRVIKNSKLLLYCTKFRQSLLYENKPCKKFECWIQIPISLYQLCENSTKKNNRLIYHDMTTILEQGLQITQIWLFTNFKNIFNSIVWKFLKLINFFLNWRPTNSKTLTRPHHWKPNFNAFYVSTFIHFFSFVFVSGN